MIYFKITSNNSLIQNLKIIKSNRTVMLLQYRWIQKTGMDLLCATLITEQRQAKDHD